jgi:hypothetical protein
LGVWAHHCHNLNRFLLSEALGGCAIEFIVWVETRLADKTVAMHEVAKIDRVATEIGPEELGLMLADGKTVLKQVQERIVQNQIDEISAGGEPVPAVLCATIKLVHKYGLSAVVEGQICPKFEVKTGGTNRPCFVWQN